jgi:hypothetical protein
VLLSHFSPGPSSYDVRVVYTPVLTLIFASLFCSALHRNSRLWEVAQRVSFPNLSAFSAVDPTPHSINIIAQPLYPVVSLREDGNLGVECDDFGDTRVRSDDNSGCVVDRRVAIVRGLPVRYHRAVHPRHNRAVLSVCLGWVSLRPWLAVSRSMMYLSKKLRAKIYFGHDEKSEATMINITAVVACS